MPASGAGVVRTYEDPDRARAAKRLDGGVFTGAAADRDSAVPHPPLWQGLPQSSVYYDRHGALLRITLANDDRYRLWTPLEQVSPLAVRGLLLHEDRWFYYNPGFNPVSLMRGFWRSYVAGGKMQGGSTISMQLARMRWHLNTRTPGGKLLQVLRAVQLELSYSKRDIPKPT